MKKLPPRQEAPPYDKLKDNEEFIRATQLYSELACEVGPYSEIVKKTGRFNKLIRRMFGERVYMKDRLDAHHIVETRCFRKFKMFFRETFNWHSPKDMPSIAIPHEFHIESTRGESLNVSPLSTLISRDIDLINITCAKVLLKRYEEFYRRNNMWDKVGRTFQSLYSQMTQIDSNLEL